MNAFSSCVLSEPDTRDITNDWSIRKGDPRKLKENLLTESLEGKKRSDTSTKRCKENSRMKRLRKERY